MFIDSNQLKSLETKSDPAGAITIYLYSSPQETYQAFRMKVHSRFDQVKKRLENFRNRKNKFVKESLATLEQSLVDSFAEKKGETSCIFISADFKKVVKAPVKLKDNVLIENNFYLLPLIKVLDQFDRYGVLVFNRQKARFFNYYLDRIKEEESVFHDYVLPNIKESSATDRQGNQWGSKTIANKEKETYQRHLKEISKLIFKYFKAKKFDKLIIAAHKDEVEAIKPHLHSYLSSNLVAQFHADVNMPNQEIQQLVKKTVNSLRQKKESDKIEELRAAYAHNKAVVGLNSVLDVIEEKNIKELIIGDDFHESGFICPESHFLTNSRRPDNRCPVCSKELDKTESFENEIAEKALDQGAAVYNITLEKESFDDYKIGALLRF